MFSTNRSHAVKNGSQNGIHNRRRVPILHKYVDNILMNIFVTHIYFILIITWSFAYSCGQQRNRRDTKCRLIDDDFDEHADVVVRCRTNLPMKHNQGFTRSQWMLPSGECSHRIAAAAALVDDFGRKHKTLTKNYF